MTIRIEGYPLIASECEGTQEKESENISDR